METFPIDYPRVLEAFEFLQDWDARYHFITELGEKLPHYPDNTDPTILKIPIKEIASAPTIGASERSVT